MTCPTNVIGDEMIPTAPMGIVTDMNSPARAPKLTGVPDMNSLAVSFAQVLDDPQDISATELMISKEQIIGETVDVADNEVETWLVAPDDQTVALEQDTRKKAHPIIGTVPIEVPMTDQIKVKDDSLDSPATPIAKMNSDAWQVVKKGDWAQLKKVSEGSSQAGPSEPTRMPQPLDTTELLQPVEPDLKSENPKPQAHFFQTSGAMSNLAHMHTPEAIRDRSHLTSPPAVVARYHPQHLNSATRTEADVADGEQPTEFKLAESKAPTADVVKQKTEHIKAVASVSANVQASGQLVSQNPRPIQNTVELPKNIAVDATLANTKQLSLAQVMSEAAMSYAPSLEPKDGLQSQPHQTRLATPILPTPVSTVQPLISAQRIDGMTVGVAQSDGSVEVTLKPDDLGRMSLRLETVGAITQVLILTERADTQDLVKRHIELLHTQLADMGFENLSFGFGGSQSDQDARDLPDIEQAEDAQSSPSQSQNMTRYTVQTGMDIKV